jgi:hypothetical protein
MAPVDAGVQSSTEPWEATAAGVRVGRRYAARGRLLIIEPAYCRSGQADVVVLSERREQSRKKSLEGVAPIRRPSVNS